jgi:5-methylthioadenosine/S-adenosylhomocysteine deaminase
MTLRFLVAAILSTLLTGSAAAAPLVIGGTVITPSGALPNAWIVIDQGKIQAIQTTQPAIPGARVLATRDLIFPGFVDLHDHPAYNVIPRWSPGRLFDNRYQWRNAADYKKAIALPQGALIRAAGGFCDIDEFAEVKALIGGTTTLIGISSFGPLPVCASGLTRNLDLVTGFYPRGAAERVRNEIGIQDKDGIAHDMNPAKAAEIAAQLSSGALDLLAIHAGEGKRGDPLSVGELDLIDQAHMLGAHTVLVHGTAFDGSAFARIHAAGASLVWSPRSNIELYGETTDIGAARAAGVPVAIAPDWSPSGSDNTLAELRYAAALDPAKYGGPALTAKDLFEMATIVPARLAHIDDRVGSLAPGLYADLFVIPGDAARPYEALLQSGPDDVALVLVAGEPLYGAKANLGALGVTATEDVTLCAGAHALSSVALPAGPFAAARARMTAFLKTQGSDLAPLAECPGVPHAVRPVLHRHKPAARHR